MSNNNLEVKVVSVEDVLKTSYENDTNNPQLIVSYDSNDKSMDLSGYASESLNYEDIQNGQISFVDSEGKPVIIEGLNYYIFDKDGKLVSLTIDELKELLKENDNNTSIFISEKKLDDGLIASDLDYVNDSMSSLVGFINADGEIAYSAASGEAGLYGAMYDVTSYYKKINNNLYTNIVNEAEAISQIATSYDQLDSAASQNAQSHLSGGHSGHSGSYSGGGYSGGSESTNKTSQTVNGMTAEEINANTKQLIESTKTNALSSKYDSIKNLLGENLEAGKIGKMDVTKLGSTLDTILPSLKNDAQNCTNMITSLDSFISDINSNGKLKGSNWNDVKANLETYKSLLNASVSSSDFLSGVLNASKKMIEDFLYPDTELDDSVLPELKQNYDELIAQIDDLNGKVAYMKSTQKNVCSYELAKTSEGIEYSRIVECHLEPSDAEISALQTTINEYKTKADDIKKQIDRINDFAVVVNNAQKMINDATEEVKNTFSNPVKNAQGNEEFKANFILDLSAYGLKEGSNAYKLLYDYTKKAAEERETEAKKNQTNKNATYLKVGDYTFDTTNMSANAKSILNEIIKSWPESMESQRYQAVQKALSLLNKGISYSMPRRWAKDKNGNPVSMDCSSFVTTCLRAAGQTINARKNVYTGSYLDSKINSYVDVKRSELLPGDVGLYSRTTQDGGANHIGMFIGRDADGKEMWIEMNAGKNGIIVKHGNKGNGHCGFEVTRRYTAYV